MLIPWGYRKLRPAHTEEFIAFNLEIDDFLRAIAEHSKASSQTGERLSKVTGDRNQGILFPFDPNTISDSGWIKLGISERQIKIIRNFQKKGGRFRKKEDLAKIYGLDYQRLEAFVDIPSERKQVKDSKAIIKPKKKEGLRIDLNTADTTMLMELKGIGISFAKRIIKYRERLGGYYCVDQLLEVYGFDQARLDGIREYCHTGTGPYRKIPVNSVKTQELMKHPYMDYTTAKAIVDFRIARKVLSDPDQLRDLQLLPEELFEKMRPYFSLEK